MTELKRLFSIVALLLIAWALLTIRIGAPWTGFHDDNGAWTSVAVRNWQWHGFVGGMVLYNEGFDPPERFEYYVHHPPLSAYLAAPLVLLVGFDEALIRFPSAACTLIGIAALYVLIRRLFDARRAWWGGLFYAVTPMIAYYGRMPNYEAPGLMFTLLFAAVLVRWLEAPNRARWLALAALTIGAVWSDWAQHLLLALLCAAALVRVPPARRRDVIGWGAVGIAALGAMIALFVASYPRTIEELSAMFLFRTSNASFSVGTPAFTWGEYLARQASRFGAQFTPTIIMLALIGLPVVLRARRARALVIALGVASISYILLLRNASYIHDYYAIYVTIPLAICAAAAVTAPYRSRWMRPFITALILTTVIPSAIYLREMHATADDESVLRLAATLRANTEPGALVLSNYHTTGWVLGFYAERSVTPEVTPAEALARASAEMDPVYYLYCEEFSTLPPDAPITRQIDIDENCHLARLN